MPSSTKNAEDRIKDTITHLSQAKLDQLADFAEYLRSREDWEATMEIMCDPDMRKDVEEGMEQFERGDLHSWREIKEDV